MLRGLAGDAESGADLGPGVVAAAQSLDCLGYRGVDLVGEIGYEDQGFDVAIASATRPQGAPLTGLPWRATHSEADEAPGPDQACPVLSAAGRS